MNTIKEELKLKYNKIECLISVHKQEHVHHAIQNLQQAAYQHSWALLREGSH